MNRSGLALRHLSRRYSQTSVGNVTPKPPAVRGLSERVVRPPQKVEGPRVPGDKSGEYKVPEYFCYDTMSYYEAEIEMASFRLPQPSADRK